MLAGCKKKDAEIDITIQLKWLPDAQFMGYFSAKALGYYDEEGITVKIIPGGGDVSETQAVNNGTVQVGVTWVSNLISARASGMTDLIEVAQIFQRSGLYLLSRTGNEGLPAEGITAANFKTELTDAVKVGNWGYGNEYEVLALLQEATARSNKNYDISQDFTMECFEVAKSSAKYADLASAMSYNEYGLTINNYTGTVNNNLKSPDKYNRENIAILDMNDAGVAMLEDCMIASKTWLSADAGNADKLVKFIRASIRGWQYATEHPDEAVGHITAGGDTNLPDHQVFMTPEVAKLVKYGTDVASAAIKAGTAPALPIADVGKMDLSADGSMAATLALAKKYIRFDGDAQATAALAAMTLAQLCDASYYNTAMGK
jgi:NitT/TauT family transport system substrate-binding protein